ARSGGRAGARAKDRAARQRPDRGAVLVEVAGGLDLLARAVRRAGRQLVRVDQQVEPARCQVDLNEVAVLDQSQRPARGRFRRDLAHADAVVDQAAHLAVASFLTKDLALLSRSEWATRRTPAVREGRDDPCAYR